MIQPAVLRASDKATSGVTGNVAGYAFDHITDVRVEEFFDVFLGDARGVASGESPTRGIRISQRRAAFHRDDIDKALADMGDAFDIGRDDLELLLSRAEHHAGVRLKV